MSNSRASRPSARPSASPAVAPLSLHSTRLVPSATPTASASARPGTANGRPSRPSTASYRTRPALRGNAAAVDMNSLYGEDYGDPLSSGPSNGVVSTADALENEYIVNLQQQVYFLELELNLLKKSGSAGSGPGLRGSAADSALDSLSPDAPLDDVILNLREKYIKMEAEYKEKVADLQRQVSELSKAKELQGIELSQRGVKMQQLMDENDILKRTLQEHKTMMMDAQLGHDAIMKRMQAKLDARDATVEKLRAELAAQRAAARVAADRADQQTAELLKELQAANERRAALEDLYRKASEQILELQFALQNPQQSALQDQLQQLQADLISMEAKVKKYQALLAQAEAVQRTKDQQIEQALDDNERLHRQIEAVNDELRKRVEKEERDRAARVFWSSEIVDLKKKCDEWKEEKEELENAARELREKNKLLREELITAKQFLEEAQNRVNESELRAGQLEAAEAATATQNASIGKELALRVEENRELEAKLRSIQETLERLTMEKNGLQLEVTDLRHQLELAAGISELKLHEFVTMAHSNLKVAGAIESLMEKMKNKPNQPETVKHFNDQPSHLTGGSSTVQQINHSSAVNQRVDERPAGVSSLSSPHAAYSSSVNYGQSFDGAIASVSASDLDPYSTGVPRSEADERRNYYSKQRSSDFSPRADRAPRSPANTAFSPSQRERERDRESDRGASRRARDSLSPRTASKTYPEL